MERRKKKIKADGKKYWKDIVKVTRIGTPPQPVDDQHKRKQGGATSTQRRSTKGRDYGEGRKEGRTLANQNGHNF